MTGSISAAQVIKDGSVFFLCDRDGQVPLGGEHGFGLYYHDCRYLNGYELRVANVQLDMLASTAFKGFASAIELTNPDFHENGRLIKKEQVGIRWERTVDGHDNVLQDQFEFRNYGVEHVEVPASLEFSSSFESVFTVRGMEAEKRGALRQAKWQDGRLVLAYDGADGLVRSVTMTFSPAPTSTRGSRADFVLKLDAGGSSSVSVTLAIAEHKKGEEPPKPVGTFDVRRAHAAKRQEADTWLAGQTRVATDSHVLRNVIDRALRDLHMLRNSTRGKLHYSAGVPWYVALFGRDSLISAYQTLAFDPGIAADTLRLLAEMQGTRHDAWRDEEPGKIMHELRVGEMAHLNEIPQTPYYGTVDATPLFLALIFRHATWTGSLDLFKELQPHIDRALEWIDRYGDTNHDGFVEYATASSRGLSNQGWKDSGDSIMNADGSLARPPISLVEVQGYVYMAKRGLALLYRKSGDPARADKLNREATELRERFNNCYWVDDIGFYAIALQKDDRPAAVVSSNPGQALWSGIVDEDKAHIVAKRLLEEDMYSGWGIRTLSSTEKRYNPIGYHLGTVWPHDNSIIAAGFRRYGFASEALKVFTGIIAAASHFPHYRLPEVFAGFPREAFPEPVRYPVACHPQAWAAGSVPFLLESSLGLSADALEHTLHVVEPVLPDFVRSLELHGMRVGEAHVDLHFERETDGRVSVDVMDKDRNLQVVTKPGRSGG